MSSGAANGKWGVELWINLQQPFATVKRKHLCFQKGDFHVAHRDPRRFVVDIKNNYLAFWCMVVHTPQSGLPLGERQRWWTETNGLLLHNSEPGEELAVCIDENAAPGSADVSCVFL